MPYEEAMIAPMRAEVARLGVQELKSSADVDQFVKNAPGTALIFINSVCGCAAGGARPALSMALKHTKLPERLGTVFAGQDRDATQQARSYLVGYAPSSPSMAILKGGKVVFMLERHQIEGRMPQEIAAKLTDAFEKHC